MNEHNKPVMQCKRCGAVITRIQSKTRIMLLEVEPELIHESRGGQDIGYTLSGRRIEGYYLAPGDKQTGYEVHRIHQCKAVNAAPVAAAR